jgi:Flp pilus assembly protein TadG
LIRIASDQLRRPRNNQRGSTLVEFGLVAIILLSLLFGIIDFSRALYAYHFVANAAREATRFAIVRGGTCTGLSSCPADADAISTYVFQMAQANGITQNSSDIETVTTWNNPPSSACNIKGYSNGVDPQLPDNPGCVVQINVTLHFKFIFPLLPTGTYNMKSGSQMVISQ